MTLPSLQTLRHFARKRIIILMPILPITGFLTLGIILWYRLNVLKAFNRAYEQFDSIGPGTYFLLSVYNDTTVILSILVIMILFTLIRPWPKFFALIVILLTGTFHVFAYNFFTIYETSFQRNFFGSEHLTGIRDMAVSFMAEIDVSLIHVLIAITAITVAALFIYTKIMTPGLKQFQLLACTAIVIMLIIISKIFSLAPATAAAAYPQLGQKKITAILHEFAKNPLKELFTPEKKITLSYDMPLIKELPTRLDTTSITANRHFNSITTIPRGERPNIIIYLFESTTTQYLARTIGGKPVTPWLHRFTNNSMFFQNHYTNYPLSAQALYTILTSTYGTSSGETIFENFHTIDRRTLPEILHHLGYRTMLIHTGNLKYAEQERYLETKKFDRIIQYKNLRHRPPYNKRVGWGVDERSMLQPALEFVREDREKPFFIIFMPVNPHHPYEVPDEEFMIAGTVTQSLLSKEIREKIGIAVPEDESQTETKPLTREEIWIKYLNSLHFADHAMGYIINGLDRHGFLDNTLTFIAADHGEAFYQHRANYNHPFFLYEENVAVPFMLYSKKYFPEPVIYEGISRHIDIMPTILDILDAELLADTEGISLFAAHDQQMALLQTTWRDHYLGIRDGEWKYILRLKDNDEELYNLLADPGEHNNVAEEYADLVSQYRTFVLFGKLYKKTYYHQLFKQGNDTP